MSFLRSCIYLVIVVFIGSLMANFMFTLDVLPVESNPGLQNVNDTNFFEQMTTLKMDSDSGEPVSITDMDGFWEKYCTTWFVCFWCSVFQCLDEDKLSIVYCWFSS